LLDAVHQRGEYTISTDRTKLNPRLIHDYLSHSSYWAQGRTFAQVRDSIQHSLCFGVYRDAQQVGFARVVTDCATFAWMCDVFILEPHQGRGLGKWLIQVVVSHPKLQDLGIFILATRDAHELYRHYGGFEDLHNPQRWMARRKV
jgi:GNAT superfamily N-acetyltransferase